MASLQLDDSIHNLFISFLKNKNHSTELLNRTSSALFINSSVVQGSVLGPSSFYIYASSLVLKELHWLEIDDRIEYKIALQMYKCLSNKGPAYLTRDLVPVASLPEKQRLRSAKSKDVVANKHKLKSLGLSRFSVSGPKLWNNLPNSLKSSSSTKSFGRSPKTYLFNKSFPPS